MKVKFILFVLIILSNINSNAQTENGEILLAPTPVFCGVPLTQNINIEGLCGTYDEMQWNWEVEDCKNWAAYSNGVLKYINNPFTSSQSGKLNTIQNTKDYLKTDGWVLIKREFGCKKSDVFPHFILYNKFTTLLRIFIYPGLKVDASKYLLKLTSVSKVSNVTSDVNNDIDTPDKFPQSTTVQTPLYSYVNANGSGDWIVADFAMNFDPNIANDYYDGIEMQIEALNIVESNLKANITGVSSTTNILNNSNINFSSNDAKPLPQDNLKTVLTAKGKKFVQMGDDGLASLDNMHKGLDSLRSNLEVWKNDNATLESLYNKISFLSKATNPKSGVIGSSISSLYNLSKAVGGGAGMVAEAADIIDYVGKITGFWNLFDEDATTVAPVINYYNLTLDGTITTSTTAAKITFAIPGSLKTGVIPNSQPYYDAPLGVCNFKSSPKAQKIKYDRYVGYNRDKQSCFGPIGDFEHDSRNVLNYQSVKLSNDLDFIVNNCSELNFVGMDVALVAKFNYNPITKDVFNETLTSTTFCDRDQYSIIHNPILRDLEANFYTLSKYDDKNKYYEIRTPYISYKAAKGLSMQMPDASKIVLRIRAVFTVTGKSNPYIYTTDYNIDYQDVSSTWSNPFDFTYRQDDPTGEYYTAIPPFANGTPQDYVMNITASNSGGNPKVGKYANIKVNKLNQNSLSNKFDIIASRSINITESNLYQFEGKIDNGYITPTINNNVTFELAQNKCIYNSNSFRVENIVLSENIDEQILKIYPNPSSKEINIEHSIDNIISIKISDIQGKLQLSNTLCTPSVLLDVSILEKGIYFIEVFTTNGKYVEKLIKN